MENLEVISFSIYKLDVDKDQHETVNFDSNKYEKVVEYVKRVLEQILKNETNRRYKFIQEGDSVPLQVLGIFNDQYAFESNSEEIAKKLHSEERKIQNKIGPMGKKVTEGALFQVYIKLDQEFKYLILKIDNNDYFDLNELVEKSGLPSSNKRVQKVAIISAEDGAVTELVLSDSKNPITPYWYNEFLVAEAVNSSEKNTKDSFIAIDKVIKKIKDKSKYDFWIIRNDIINYYRNSDNFVFEDIVDKVENHKVEFKTAIRKEVKDYDENKEYRFKDVFPKIVKSLKELPKKNGFDTKFDLKPKEINVKLVNKIVLDEFFELSIKGNIEDLRSKIKSGEDDVGKFIKIYSVNGFNNFDTGE
jgi:hypothetical protein